MEQRERAWPCMAATVLGILCLAVFPLWQDLSYAHITRAKWLGTLTLGGLAVLTAVMAAILLACRRHLRGAIRLHPVQVLALAYFGWVALSAWQGAWADVTNSRGEVTVWMGAIRYEGLLTHLCYAGIFLALSFLPARIGAVCTAAALALIAFGGMVAAQYAGINVLGLFPEGRSIYTNYEFQGTIGNIDMVSGYLSLLTPLMLGGFVIRQKGGWLLLAAGFCGAAMEWCMEVQSGLIALMLLAALLLLLTLRQPAWRFRGCLALGAIAAGFMLRGMLFLPWLDSASPRTEQPVRWIFTMQAGIGLAAVLIWTALAAMWLRKPGKAVPRRVVICLVLAVALLAVAAVALLPIPESMGGLYELHEMLNGRVQDHFGSWRMGAWRHALDMSRGSLLFGNGPDTFYYALQDHLEAVGASLGENFDNPHNEYVAILVNNGLPALVFYVLLVGGVVLACIRHKQWALALSVGCYAVQGFFSFSICLVSPMFWAVMGMAAAQCGKPLQIEHKRAIIHTEVN